MSSLTLITGTIDEAKDPKFRLNLGELYYETWEEDLDDPDNYIVETEEVPITFSGNSKVTISQDKGSGKTLYGIHRLSIKAFFGGRVAANLPLIWNNIGKPKKEWLEDVVTFEDLRKCRKQTVLIDDAKETIRKWNTAQADVLNEISGGSRKNGLDLMFTSQRENQIPPEIRDQATEWIVPIIRVRDNTQKNDDDNTGRPIEMIALHFNGAKVFTHMEGPIIDLYRLFECYDTIQRATSLKEGVEGARTNQPGYELEAKAFDYLKEKVPGMNWEHLNGKNVFDVVSETHAIDIVGLDPDGALILEHKDLAKHMRTAKRLGQKPYLMFYRAKEWHLLQITPNLSDLVEGKRISPDRIANTRYKTIEKAMSI